MGCYLWISAPRSTISIEETRSSSHEQLVGPDLVLKVEPTPTPPPPNDAQLNTTQHSAYTSQTNRMSVTQHVGRVNIIIR